MAPALAQGCLPALAVHIVQEDGPTPLAEGHGSWEGDGMATAQLATHHIGIHNVPVIITDCPPGAVVEDLHSPLAPAGPIGETDLWEGGDREVTQQVMGSKPTSNSRFLDKILSLLSPSPVVGLVLPSSLHLLAAGSCGDTAYLNPAMRCTITKVRLDGALDSLA